MPISTDRILDQIPELPANENASVFAEVVVALATEGQSALRDALRSLDARDDAGAFDELTAAIEDWEAEQS